MAGSRSTDEAAAVPTKRHKFRAALRFHWLTRYYDRILDLTMKDRWFKQVLIESATLQPGHRVLDFGCGTGTLAMMVKQQFPAVDVTGLDVDPRILGVAKRKSSDDGVDVHWFHGTLQELVARGDRFDRVLSSLVFHHLTLGEKLEAFERLYDLLKPGGEIHIADIGEPQNAMMRAASLTVQFLDGFDRVGCNIAGKLPALLEQAGFTNVARTTRTMTICGTLAMYEAVRP